MNICDPAGTDSRSLAARSEFDSGTVLSMWMPTDLHCHFRMGAMARYVTVPHTKRRFCRGLAMPNLDDQGRPQPVTTMAALTHYQRQLMSARDDDGSNDHPDQAFQFLMTLYLTDTLRRGTVVDCCKLDDFVGVKYYPQGVTTNSEHGLTDPAAMWSSNTNAFAVLQALADHNRVLLCHPADRVDCHGNELDPYEQEHHFLRETLPRIREAHPRLKISLEHISTEMGAATIVSGDELLGGSLTPHHLLLDRRDLFRGGFRPNNFWIPILQPKEDRDALRALARSGHPRVWLGSDSAPHLLNSKLGDCCKGGVLTAHAAVELYAEAFEGFCENMQQFADIFEPFACFNGPRFFGLPALRQHRMHLTKQDWRVRHAFYAEGLAADSSQLIPFRAGEICRWAVTRSWLNPNHEDEALIGS